MLCFVARSDELSAEANTDAVVDVANIDCYYYKN